MLPVYSIRFLAVSGTAGGSYTVPAGKVAVLRTITAVNLSAAAEELYAILHQPSGVFIARGLLPTASSTAVYNSVLLGMRFVANAGEQIVAGGQADVHITASGYLLSLP